MRAEETFSQNPLWFKPTAPPWHGCDAGRTRSVCVYLHLVTLGNVCQVCETQLDRVYTLPLGLGQRPSHTHRPLPLGRLALLLLLLLPQQSAPHSLFIPKHSFLSPPRFSAPLSLKRPIEVGTKQHVCTRRFQSVFGKDRNNKDEFVAGSWKKKQKMRLQKVQAAALARVFESLCVCRCVFRGY